MKRNFEDKKDSKVKKTPNISTVNHNSSDSGRSTQSNQYSQMLGWCRKKSFHLYQDKKSQSSNISVTRINITMIKKDKKYANKDLS